ncbi:MAG: FkbM family methyltransferase [Aphanizomenon sp.]|jgi:FkbM family methyltransferase
MNISKFILRLPKNLRKHKFIQLLLLIFPDSSIQKISFNNKATVFVDLRDAAPRQALITGLFEPEFFDIAKPFLIKGGVFFDIGANWGFCSYGLVSLINKQNLECHLFEANPVIAKILDKSKLLYPDFIIQVNNCCVTDREGISNLTINSNDLGQSFIDNEGTYTIDNLILDNYIEKNNIKKINFMKMDIEGYEPFAIKGCINSLKQGIIEVVYFEVVPSHLRRNGYDPSDCFKLLVSFGYELFFCKKRDWDLGIVSSENSFEYDLNGYPLKLSKMNQFPDGYSTDILAIHNKFIKL